MIFPSAIMVSFMPDGPVSAQDADGKTYGQIAMRVRASGRCVGDVRAATAGSDEAADVAAAHTAAESRRGHIRRYCLQCSGGQARQAALCPNGAIMPPRSLYPYRYGTKPSAKSLEGWEGNEPLRPLRAIRERCLDCAPEDAWHGHCDVKDCPLYLLRLGKNPNRAGMGNSRWSRTLHARPQAAGVV